MVIFQIASTVIMEELSTYYSRTIGFNKVLNAASWKATSTHEGNGIAFTFGENSPAIYGYITLTEKSRVLAVQFGVFSGKHDGAGTTPYLDNRLLVLVLVSMVQDHCSRYQMQKNQMHMIIPLLLELFLLLASHRKSLSAHIAE